MEFCGFAWEFLEVAASDLCGRVVWKSRRVENWEWGGAGELKLRGGVYFMYMYIKSFVEARAECLYNIYITFRNEGFYVIEA